VLRGSSDEALPKKLGDGMKALVMEKIGQLASDFKTEMKKKVSGSEGIWKLLDN
jgi:hypothetical protein